MSGEKHFPAWVSGKAEEMIMVYSKGSDFNLEERLAVNFRGQAFVLRLTSDSRSFLSEGGMHGLHTQSSQ